MDIALYVAVIIVLLAGTVKGFTGFGYALIATTLLASVLPAPDAVTLLIPSLIAVNIELVGSLSPEKLWTSLKEYRLYFLTAILGTTIGMVGIERIPGQYLKLFIGLFALVFVWSRLDLSRNHFERLSGLCFKKLQSYTGLFTGLIYGSTNIGLPAVSYFESQEKDLKKFKALLAAFILTISIYRMVLASTLGLFETPNRMITSLILMIPALIGTKIGEELQKHFEDEKVRKIVLVLIAAIGVQILATF